MRNETLGSKRLRSRQAKCRKCLAQMSCSCTKKRTKRTLQPRSSNAKSRQKACAQWLAWTSGSWLIATRHGSSSSPMMMKVQLLPIPLPPVPRWHWRRRQRRSTTPLPLLPRLWTQVTSPSGMCSMFLPFPCLPKTMLQTNFRALCSAHAGLLLCYMSPEVEAAFLEQAQALYAGFQELYQHPATAEDVRSYQSFGNNAHNKEEVQWFEATYDYLEGQLNDAERAQRLLPAKKRRCGRSATSAPAAPAVPSPATVAGPRTTPRATRADDTEDDNEPSFTTPSSKKRGHKAR